MGTKVDDISQVNITRESAKVTRVGFGTGLHLAVHAGQDAVMTFSDLDEVVDAGFAAGSAIYKAGAAYFGQEVSPAKWKLGLLKPNVAQVAKVTVSSAAANTVYSVTVNGHEYSHTTSASATTVEVIAAALVSAIAADTNAVVTATAPSTADGAFTLTSKSAGVPFNAVVTNAIMAYSVTTENVNAASCLYDCIAADPDFWAITMEHRTNYEEDAKLIMEAVATMKRTFFMSSASEAILTNSTTDIGSYNKSKGYNRSWVFYSADAASYPECALIGRILPEDAGSINWKFTVLQGIVADKLSGTQLSNLKAKHVNYIEEVGGAIIVSSEAVMGSGEYVDIVHGIDWLSTEISTNVFGLLKAVKKVPMTNAGITQVVTYIRGPMDTAVSRQFITKDYKIKQPDISEISNADRASRLLSGIKFRAILQGAANTVIINGGLADV